MLLVISDIHNRVDWIEPFLAKTPHDQVIFLGDYFDDFNDTPEDAEKTALWLKESIQQPNRIHLWGNHDLSYFFFPVYKWLFCPGFTNEKQKAILAILDRDEVVSKLKFWHVEGDHIFSHAGMSPKIFLKPYQDFNEEYLTELHRKLSTMVEVDPRTYLGWNQTADWYDGVTWLRWAVYTNYLYEGLPGFSQVVGHTYYRKPAKLSHKDGRVDWCIDTANAHYGILNNGKFEVFERNS